MKIKFTQDVGSATYHYYQDTIAEVPDELAKQFLDDGVAVQVNPPVPEPKPEPQPVEAPKQKPETPKRKAKPKAKEVE